MIIKEDFVVRNSNYLVEYFNNKIPYLKNKEFEDFYLIVLNSNNGLLGIHKISSGISNQCLVNIVLIMRKLINTKYVNRFILVHNHPSGYVKPSEEDKKLTKKFIEIGKLIEVKCLDHIIIGKNNYYSFNDEGLML